MVGKGRRPIALGPAPAQGVAYGMQGYNPPVPLVGGPGWSRQKDRKADQILLLFGAARKIIGGTGNVGAVHVVPKPANLRFKPPPF
jgi:hypothetical protein